MMNVAELFSRLSEAGIRLQKGDNDQLIVKGNKQALTPELVGQIKQLKPQILARLADAATQTKDIELQPRDKTHYPVSYAQRRLWFVERYNQDDTNYAVPSALKLGGVFDVKIAEQAFGLIIERHESLRTRFEEVDGEPMQVIDPPQAFHIDYQDLTALDADARAQGLEQALVEYGKERFDLSTDLMIRAKFIRLNAKAGEEQGALLFNIHHITSDAWSMTVLVDEFVNCYRALVKGQQPTLPQLPIQYLDYSLHHQQVLEHKAEQQLSYWRNKLANAPSFHSLPVDRGQPHLSKDGGYYHGWFDLALATRLQQLAASNGATMFMLVHAALSLLVARFSDQDQVVLGTTITNRQQAELAPLIGFFANTLALYTDISSNPDFLTYLQQVRQVNIEANANQDVPFDRVIDEVKPQRRAGSSPLFQVLFEYEQSQNIQQEVSELSVDQLYADDFTIQARFDLTIRSVMAEQGIHFGFDYDPNVFTSSTMEAMFAALGCLLKSIVADPNCPIKQLSMTDKPASIQSGESIPLSELALHQQVEAVAERTPDAMAVAGDDQNLSYEQLNDAANRLAHCLKALGVSEGQAVAVCMQRSSLMPVALLAILKAGGRYLPLEPSLPEARLLDMAEDAEVRFVLGQQHLADIFSGEVDMFLSLDDEGLQDTMQMYPSDNLEVEVSPTDLAYQIYTSGSTGKPKGVLLSHQSVTNYLAQVAYHYDCPQDAVVSSALCFDATVTALWYPLVTGGCCHLLTADEELRQLPTHLAGPARLFKLTPAHLQALHLMGATQGSPCDSAHTIVIGGEALTKAVLAPWQQYLPNATFINEYGPTEATVGCISNVITSADNNETNKDNREDINIGLPLANVTAVVVNDCGSVAPLGAMGELYLAGPGLAQGYHNLPQVNNERFVSIEGLEGRFYRTGDLVRARLDIDGNVSCFDYFGRDDAQLNIRGYRVEATEIAAAIAQQPQAQQAHVTLLTSSSGESRLTAYVVSPICQQQDQRVAVGQIKNALRASLPEYMIPVDFIFLTELPLNVNGKVDSERLPDQSAAVSDVAFNPPSTEVETKLVDIWAELLGIDSGKISVDDNFFALGGHSLMVVKLLSNIRQQIFADFNPNQLFDHLTVADLARTLEAAIAQAKVAEELADSDDAQEMEW